jgi:uncharacterized delta-60 repeat protein
MEDRCLLSAGALDTTFGGTGMVTTSLSRGTNVADAVLIQPWDGKIVAAGGSNGNLSLTRYTTNGSLDSTFGRGGIEVSKIGSNFIWFAAALYPHAGTANDGKIVVAGGSSVARFNANGSLDSAFGRRGAATVSLDGPIASVVIQSDGKIAVDGGDEVARLNLNGTLDTTFGSGGIAKLPGLGSGGTLGAWGMGVQADGKLVVAGSTTSTAPNAWEVGRFNANGTLDTTFNSAGPVPGTASTFAQAWGDAARGLAIYPNSGPDTADYGKIAVVGSLSGNPGGNNGSQIGVARFNADGTSDSTFGQSGQVVTPFPMGGGGAWAAAIQVDGKIVVAGQTDSVPSGSWYFSLLRYNTNGSLDSSFSNSYGSLSYPNGGLVVTPVGTGDAASEAYGVAIQSDGRIVAAGKMQLVAGSSNFDFMVARYLPGPEIGTFTSSASTVTSGSGLTLSASNLSDGDPSGSGYATITQLAFYAIDSSGNRLLLGYAMQQSGVWTFNYTVSVASGSYKLFAEATDSDGIVGDSAFLSLTVQ